MTDIADALREALQQINDTYVNAPGFAAPIPTTELIYKMYSIARSALAALQPPAGHDYMATEPGGACVHCRQGPHVSSFQPPAGKGEIEPGELRPCPFCGGEAERIELTDEENFGGSIVSCKKCQACTAVHFDRKEHLDSSWNERTLSSRSQEGREGVIEECAIRVEDHDPQMADHIRTLKSAPTPAREG